MSEMEIDIKTMNYTFDTRSALCDVIQALGFDPQKISVEDLQKVADKLSALANKQPGWKWRYLRSVLSRDIEPSRKLVDAMMKLGAVIDSTPEDLAKSVRTMVQAAGRVRPGALVLADSKSCANPGCRIEFVPRTPNQVCHSAECAKIYRRLKRQQSSAGKEAHEKRG